MEIRKLRNSINFDQKVRLLERGPGLATKSRGVPRKKSTSTKKQVIRTYLADFSKANSFYLRGKRCSKVAEGGREV